MSDANANPAASSNRENIRKQVGQKEEASILDRVWNLRNRLIELGVDFEDDDEWIRKTVG